MISATCASSDVTFAKPALQKPCAHLPASRASFLAEEKPPVVSGYILFIPLRFTTQSAGLWLSWFLIRTEQTNEYESVELKKNIQPKSCESRHLTEDCKLGHHLSESSEEPGWKRFLLRGRKKQVVKHQKITPNHKEQISQVNDFSALLCLGRYKILDLLKLCLIYSS